jgi:NAD(P)-dependent dehydrogenase (short-subunit alcohol dehydrogenase family)
MALLPDLCRVAPEIRDAELSGINVLLNNAGGIFNTHQYTSEGLGKTTAVNHRAYFVDGTAQKCGPLLGGG